MVLRTERQYLKKTKLLHKRMKKYFYSVMDGTSFALIE